MEAQLLDCYERIASASGQMLDAARRGDWEALVAAETECGALIDEARRLRAGGRMSAAGEARRLSALRKVLQDDAEIRNLMQPWLNTLDGVMDGRLGKSKPPAE